MRKFLGHLAVPAAALALCIVSSSAQIFSPLHTFATANTFSAPLTQGPDGTLYGTSSGGGLAGDGTVFKLHSDGNGFTVLYSFTNGFDGGGPVAGLVLSGNTLYGTAKNAGAGGHGTVFEINTDGTGFVPIYAFTTNNSFGTNSDGALPTSKLVLADGVLYGTTSSDGGHNDAGTIFKMNTDGSGFKALFSFGGITSSNGAYPLGGLVLSGSALYGTTQEGGTNFVGTIFTIDTNGLNFAVLHTFSTSSIGTNADGYYPMADLIFSGNTLYGSTMNGSPKGDGTLFRMNTDGSGFTNLYNFTNGVDGSQPQSALLLSGDTLYGTAKLGGISPGYGTIFKINTNGTGFTTVYSFDGRSGSGVAQPVAGLVQSGDTLFGTAGSGVFSFNTNGTNITVLATGSEGAKPLGGLTLSQNTLYGTTSTGGAPNSGTIYGVNRDGSDFQTLYTFSATHLNGSGNFTNSDGDSPRGTLVLTGGKLFGSANIGGPSGFGTLFSLNTNGTGFTNLYSFTNGVDGKNPATGLTLGGNTLYGTTFAGGTNNVGTIFKINTDGSGYVDLYSFSASSTSNLDGIHPEGTLLLLGDTLYGTTFFGGTNGSGTLFKIGTNGAGFTVLFTFVAPTGQGDTTNIYGANPAGGLIASGSTIFGTASQGGIGDNGKAAQTRGTIFKVNSDGSGFTLLHSFAGNFDGSSPTVAMALSGNVLYGAASTDGNGSAGTLFQLDTNGNNYATIHTFAFQGGTPVGDLIADNGVIYGTSEFSDHGSGYVFSVTPTAASTIHFTASPTNGIPPQAIQFSAPGVDDNGNTVLGWYWNFDDGTPTFTITYTTNKNNTIFTNYNYISTQNPLHTYTNNATYTPSLIATNNNGRAVFGLGPAIVIAYPSSILNSGFETGTFTNWTRTGVGGSSISTSTQYKHSGSYGANLSASGGLGYLSQTISTTPGSSYLVSFWLDIPFSFPSGEFLVTWGGNVLMDRTNIPATGWTNIQFLVTATNPTTVLQFGYRDDFFGLDDVSAISTQPVISGFTLSGTNLVLNNSGGLSNHSYVVLTSTNPALPFAQWTPIATNAIGSNGNFSITATNAVDRTLPREFYILQMQ